ncbi:hypothetical protein ACFL02_08405 [Planctomycetota bacterium]
MSTRQKVIFIVVAVLVISLYMVWPEDISRTPRSQIAPIAPAVTQEPDLALSRLNLIHMARGVIRKCFTDGADIQFPLPEDESYKTYGAGQDRFRITGMVVTGPNAFGVAVQEAWVVVIEAKEGEADFRPLYIQIGDVVKLDIFA